MPRIPEETVEQIIAATDIVELIGSYVPLKRAGANFKACCPFHNEKTPSFIVTPARQTFHCFGCGEGGSAIGFVMRYENLPFPDAARRLAERAGIRIIEEIDPDAERHRRLKGRLLDLHRECSRFLHEQLVSSPDAAHARDYVKSRGLDREAAERWMIGWMPESPRPFLDWARKRGFSGRELVASGIASLRDDANPAAGLYLRFRDRLMFPINNDFGDVIAFSGRQLREDPRSGKYINSPETRLFEKSRVLFALDRARRPILKEKSALLCEGQLDVISCHEHGIEHAVAPLGTAFTPQHAHLLRRYTSKVTICYDADAAGFKATERAFTELSGEDLDVTVVTMSAGDDPDSMLRREGPEAFRSLLESATPFFDFKLDRLGAEQRLASATDRVAAARDLAPLLAAIHDPLGRDTMVNHVATRLHVGTAELRASVAAAGKRPNHPTAGRESQSDRPAAVAPAPLDRTIGYLCNLVLGSAEAKHWLAEQAETLQDSGRFVEGMPLLDELLRRDFDPGTRSAALAVVEMLTPEQRLALKGDPTFLHDLPAEPLAAAQEALSRLSTKALFRREEKLKAELDQPGLAPERMQELLEEGNEIRLLINGIDQRFACDDRPVNRPQRPPAEPWRRSRQAPPSGQRNP